MTDTFANRPSTPGDTPLDAAQRAGEVTGTLAELERKLRELEQELTAIGRRRELTGVLATAEAGTRSPTQTGGRLVDEAIEPPSPGEPTEPTEPLESAKPSRPSEPASGAQVAGAQATGAQSAKTQVAGTGHPVKFSRPPEPPRTARETTPESSLRSEMQAVRSLQEPAPPSDAPTGSEPGERQRPSEAQLASLAELRRFRDRLERFARDLASEYDALLGRVMTGLTAASPPASPTSADPLPRGTQAASPPPLAPAPATPQPPTPPSPEEALFQGRVELGVGPFYDIASLSAFEQRLASLPRVIDASVRRFEASHAVVDLRLEAPMALVRELRRTTDSSFSIREVADGRILLTFDES